MRQRVTLQSLSEAARDGLNQRTKAYTTVGTYWAAVRTTSAAEEVNARQTKAIATLEVTLRYVGTIHPAWILLYRGRTFNLESVIHVDERRREYRLTCKEFLPTP
jgi:SPP1 family predicted phage head-tail adaptor